MKTKNNFIAYGEDKCVFKLKDIRKYLSSLSDFLSCERKKLSMAECGAISKEIVTWNNFFVMMDKFKVKTN